MLKALRVGRVHGFLRRGQKGDHAAVADGRRLAIVRNVDIEARQRRLTGYPAKRRRPAIGRDDATLKSERSEYSVIETACPPKITRPNSYMAEHLTLHAPIMAIRRLQKCMTSSNHIAHVTLVVYINSVT
ncbi:hypothetical protein BCEP27_20588 [Burkholderia cepacia]